MLDKLMSRFGPAEYNPLDIHHTDLHTPLSLVHLELDCGDVVIHHPDDMSNPNEWIQSDAAIDTYDYR